MKQETFEAAAQVFSECSKVLIEEIKAEQSLSLQAGSLLAQIVQRMKNVMK